MYINLYINCIVILLFAFRRFGRLWRSWMLSKSCLPLKPTVCIRSKAHWCLATETTASYNRFILWTHEIPYWWRKPTKLCQTRNIQRKVRPFMFIIRSIWINKIDLTITNIRDSAFVIQMRRIVYLNLKKKHTYHLKIRENGQMWKWEKNNSTSHANAKKNTNTTTLIKSLKDHKKH